MKKIIISIISVLVAGFILSVFIGIGDMRKSEVLPENTEVLSDISTEDLTVPIAQDFLSVRPEIASFPVQDVSYEEKIALIQMREEEKLARDVYSKLFEKWGLQIFSNIAKSENTHTEAIGALLEKYGIADPVVDNSVGVFVNTDLKSLYTDLVGKGAISLEEALTVGALIEDLDIADLEKFIDETDNEDIKFVYSNLTRGSRNHIRSFTSQLSALGVSYTSSYISAEELDTILATPRETGSGAVGGKGNGRAIQMM